MASKLEVEVELKSSADKVWESVRKSATVVPNALPDQYESFEMIQGDGKSVVAIGPVVSIGLVGFPRTGLSEKSSSEEKIEFVDEGNKTMRYSVTGGDMLKYYKKYVGSLSVEAKGDGSSVKWCLEYDKATEEVPNTDLIGNFVVKNFQDLDAYKVKNM